MTETVGSGTMARRSPSTPLTPAPAGGVLDVLFGALADPTRRALLERLLVSGPDTATRLATGCPLTRQAVVKHLQALVDAGLAAATREGREVRYRATPEPLALAVGWLIEAAPQWDRRVERLRDRARRTGSGANS